MSTRCKDNIGLAFVATSVVLLGLSLDANAQMRGPPSCVEDAIQEKARVAFGEIMVTRSIPKVLFQAHPIAVAEIGVTQA
jgi:hypothetical protein